MPRLQFALLALLSAVTGCSDAQVAPGHDPLPPALAKGVFCADAPEATAMSPPRRTETAPRGGLLIVFAGWTVQAAWAWHWLQALAPAVRAHHGVAHWCVVQGPAESSYRQKDIDTEALAQHLAAPGPLQAGPITVIAHSSGAYVAQHWMQQLRARRALAVLARVQYFNLDGDVGREERALDLDLIHTLDQVHAVYAVDRRAVDAGGGGESANATAMRALHALAPDTVRLQALDASDAGCAPRARWCLHSTLITKRPHNAQTFDLARDYGELSPQRPVQNGYLR